MLGSRGFIGLPSLLAILFVLVASVGGTAWYVGHNKGSVPQTSSEQTNNSGLEATVELQSAWLTIKSSSQEGATISVPKLYKDQQGVSLEIKSDYKGDLFTYKGSITSSKGVVWKRYTSGNGECYSQRFERAINSDKTALVMFSICVGGADTMPSDELISQILDTLNVPNVVNVDLPVSTPGMSTYIDPQNRFLFEYPASWRLERLSNRADGSDPYANLYVPSVDGGTEKIVVLTSTRMAYRPVLTNPRLTTQTLGSIKWYTGTFGDFSGSDGDTDGFTAVALSGDIALVVDGYSFAAGAQEGSSYTSELKESVSKILSSLKFTDPALKASVPGVDNYAVKALTLFKDETLSVGESGQVKPYMTTLTLLSLQSDKATFKLTNMATTSIRDVQYGTVNVFPLSDELCTGKLRMSLLSHTSLSVTFSLSVLPAPSCEPY